MERANQLVEAAVWLKLSGEVNGARRLVERALKLDPSHEKAAEILRALSSNLDGSPEVLGPPSFGHIGGRDLLRVPTRPTPSNSNPPALPNAPTASNAESVGIEVFEPDARLCAQLGLPKIRMENLGTYVVLTGKNGVGKSRILTLMQKCLYEYQSRREEPGRLESEISAYSSALEGNALATGQREQIEARLSDLKETLGRALQIQVKGATPKFVRFVASPVQLLLPEDYSPSELTARILQYEMSMAVGSQDCLAYAQFIERTWFNLSHPSTKADEGDRQRAEQHWKKLNSLVELFLGEPLRSDPKTGQLKIFDRPLAQAELSNGQNVLLQVAIALHAHKASLDETILVLDEPENHLHPSVVLELLSALERASSRIQFWIATHSIPLLAHLNAKAPDSLWFVEKDAIVKSGRVQQQVLATLIGDADRIEELRSFVALPDEAALIRFACESLLPPTVSSKSRGDPQVRQIRNALDRLFHKGTPVRVLDFGAGRGRLLEGLVSTNGVEAIQTQLDYRAFDAWDTHRADCLRSIASVYPPGSRRYFNALSDFRGECEDHSVDVIVLCNVLHELPISDWATYFGPDREFSNMLSARGVVLVVEDHKMRVGEHAHRHGFLLFGTGDLKKLFSVTEADCAKALFSVFADPMRPDRVKAHAISKSLIERFSIETARSALASLRDSAQENVRQVRERTNRTKRPGADEGQDHARWVHLFANASLALAEIGVEPRQPRRAKTKKPRPRR